MPGLLDKRLIFVMGKGGVGRSTVSIALGLLAARRGMRTIVVELASQERVQRTFDHHTEQFAEVELAPGLFTISVDPQHAMEEYLRVKAGAIGHALSASRMFQAFAMATPGMRELLSIGKVWELAQFQRRTHGAAPYDVVIVDAPATGHGIGILRTPRTFAEIARVGPIAYQGRTIATTIEDHSFTGIVSVATAEEMPVNEALAICRELTADRLPLDLVILNALYPARFDEQDAHALASALDSSESPLARAALKAALSEHTRAANQREQQVRLAEQLRCPLVELPYLFADELGRAELEQLSTELETALDGRPPAQRPTARQTVG